MKIAVLGDSGMLGSMVKKYMLNNSDLEIVCFGRTNQNNSTIRVSNVFDLDSKLLFGCDWIINCIGVIKPFIKDDNPSQVLNALNINARLPYHISNVASDIGAHIIQIGTDCVYSGSKGGYDENALHDALDVYGKSKSLGEANVDNITHIRASIIGPEVNYSRSLIEWFKSQPKGSAITGFNNHLWNGVTTFQFAKVCHGLIKANKRDIRKQHLVPADIVNKYELLNSFAELYNRDDININNAPATTSVDRTLSTINPASNDELWKLAGYTSIPTVNQMVMELKNV